MILDGKVVLPINHRLRKKYLIFRVYEDPIQIRPDLAPDCGYYFEFRGVEVKIIRVTLEDNGFRELPSSSKTGYRTNDEVININPKKMPAAVDCLNQ